MRINNIAEFESVFTKVDELVEGSLSSVFNNVDIEIKNYGKKRQHLQKNLELLL